MLSVNIMVNFTSCYDQFLNNPSNLNQYSYPGPTSAADAHEQHLMSLAGCQELCGTGMEL